MLQLPQQNLIYNRFKTVLIAHLVLWDKLLTSWKFAKYSPQNLPQSSPKSPQNSPPRPNPCPKKKRMHKRHQVSGRIFGQLSLYVFLHYFTMCLLNFIVLYMLFIGVFIRTFKVFYKLFIEGILQGMYTLFNLLKMFFVSPPPGWRMPIFRVKKSHSCIDLRTFLTNDAKWECTVPATSENGRPQPISHESQDLHQGRPCLPDGVHGASIPGFRRRQSARPKQRSTSLIVADARCRRCTGT